MTGDDIFQAIDKHDLDHLARLLAKGADPSYQEPEYQCPALIFAIEEMRDGGPDEAVALLLRYGARPMNALITAALDDNLSAAHLLIAAGADPNARDDEGYSPLRSATEMRSLAMVAALLRSGANRTIDDSGGPTGMSALGWAAHHLDLAMVKLLLAWGADPILDDVDYMIPRGHLPKRDETNAEVWDQIAALLPMRRAHGEGPPSVPIPLAPPVTRDQLGTELLASIDRHDLDALAHLLAAGADPNTRDSNSSCPALIEAIEEVADGGPLEAVALLLRYGARPGHSLITAAWNDNLETALLLLAGGTDPGLEDDKGYSPLRVAVERKNLAMAATLLRSGADKTIDSAGGPLGASALGRAVLELDLPMVKLLLAWGADPLLPDVDRMIARDHLRKREAANAQIWDEIAALLPPRSA